MKAPPSNSLFWKLMNVMSRVNVAAYRATGGRLGNHIGKAPVLLLHHVGRRSGKARVSPVLYLTDGDRLVIVASKGGTDKNPAWFHNLMGSPDTEVEVGRDRRRVRARRATDEERSAYWPRLTAIYPQYDDYQRQAQSDRVIPVVVLEPQ
ncbi:MAG TPA: nitroreductase family deazaflavin-dependent oxidoreductase [Solirubrobacteraceae bacterium]|jgi:deazaflavin-dependent oxidoreductase (nitroreductase family)